VRTKAATTSKDGLDIKGDWICISTGDCDWSLLECLQCKILRESGIMYLGAGRRRVQRCKIFLVSVVVFSLLFHEWCLRQGKPTSHENNGPLTCPDSPTTDSILLVLRTGATEHSKLPVHMSTTLRCPPHSVVYSDFAETIFGQQVHDVLANTSASLRASPAFEYYRHLQAHSPSDLETAHTGSGPTGWLENPGWALDKYKFLPMVDAALRLRPQAQWFVFIEADTYLSWLNLVSYLSLLPQDQALYIGHPFTIGDVFFAHGGSGFVLSAPAARAVSTHVRANADAYEAYTAQNWAGDMGLGKALADAGVGLTWGWPVFQGEPVGALERNASKGGRRAWCFAHGTYHHMRAREIRDLWGFEQAWAREGRGVLRHRDVFEHYVVPRLEAQREGWDNLCLDPQPVHVESVEECREVCRRESMCLQYSFAGGKCSVSKQVRYGNEAQSLCVEYSIASNKCVRWQEDGGIIRSGWMLDRLPQYMEEMDTLCHGAEEGPWVV
jgi:hypothetical protein